MRCVFCDAHDSKVIDSRSADGGYSIRRRRECIACGKRFTTYERVEQYSVFVVKRDGRREPFSIDKIKNGLRHACQKLSVPAGINNSTITIANPTTNFVRA